MKKFNFDNMIFAIILLISVTALVMMCIQADASTRPWEDDPDFIEFVTDMSEYVSEDQWNKLVVFDETETCPVHVYLPDGVKRQILSIGPGGCTPLHSEPDFSIWPPGCFFWIVKLGYGLENLLFSKKCDIHISTPQYSRGI